MKLTSPNPSAGLCISSHGNVAYTHLALEALKRNEPDLRVLVYDNYSNAQMELQLLAKLYNADFATSDQAHRKHFATLDAIAGSLKWALAAGLDIVVHSDSAMIINRPFVTGLQELFHNLTYPTVTGTDAQFLEWFRTELMAMHVNSWTASGACKHLTMSLDQLPDVVCNEAARIAMKFAHSQDDTISHANNSAHPGCDYLVRSLRSFPRHSWEAAFANWPLLGLARNVQVPGVFWENSHSINDYYQLSVTFGLPYTPNAFN